MGMNATELADMEKLRKEVESLKVGMGVAIAGLRDIRALVLELKKREAANAPRIVQPGIEMVLGGLVPEK